jgi:hypothetical protein
VGQVGKLVPVEIPGKQVVPWKKLYLLRMSDGSSVTEHLNAFNTVISQLLSVDIKITEEEKCIICCVLFQTPGIA